MQASDTLRSCLYRAAPVFAAPPCPVELGADCVALGPFAVDVHDQIAPSTSMARRNAPMPHQARVPGFVDFAGGSVTPMPHSARRSESVDVRGGSVGC